MTQKTNERVSPSMVQSVFGHLKSNGYTEGQIIALSRGLNDMALQCEQQLERDGTRDPVCRRAPTLGGLTFEYDLSQLGCL
jgi:hypothetical protein